MTLPAHRYREERKKGNGEKTAVFDFDDTITAAPKQTTRIAKGLKSLGDRVVVLTGNRMPHKQLLQTLDDLEFPYDEVLQYDDSGSNGVARAEYLKQLGAWVAFDNRIDRAVIFAPVCPTFYLVTEPTKDDVNNADGSKKDAKKAVKQLKRSEERAAAPPPPNYRPMEVATKCCGECLMNDDGRCWGYGLVEIQADHVCDSFEPDVRE